MFKHVSHPQQNEPKKLCVKRECLVRMTKQKRHQMPCLAQRHLIQDNILSSSTNSFSFSAVLSVKMHRQWESSFTFPQFKSLFC